MKVNIEFKEPDRNKTKRIIAREGLVAVLIIGLGFLLYSTVIGWHSTSPNGTGYEFKYLLDNISSLFDLQWLLSCVKCYFKDLIAVFLFLGYPIYLLIRFIIWAIKMLREGK